MQAQRVFEHAPEFHLIVEGKEDELEALKQSLKAQTCQSYKLDIVNSTDALNQAIKASTSDYLLFPKAEDTFSANAIYELTEFVLNHPTADFIYFDEDELSEMGERVSPNFKPDFSPELLCATNYIGSAYAVKKSLLKRTAEINPLYEDAKMLDYLLRMTEVAEHICHIPKILLHEAKREPAIQTSFEKMAIQAHYDRLKLPATVKSCGNHIYRAKWNWDEKPLISIIIPNKDHIEDLKVCLASIEHSSYENYELIIVENNSTEEDTFAYYKKLEQENEKAHVFYFQGEFNFSKLMNFGAEHSDGEYLLLLNNDTEMIGPDCLSEMLGYCMNPEVGIVGAKLLYPDDTVQHGGVVVGIGGIAGHTFIGFDKENPGYQNRLFCVQNYSAVTAACLMTKKSCFDEVEGFSEELKVAFNDIDYCMKVRALGKRIVFNPNALLHHFESKSRGLEDTPEKLARFDREVEFFANRWAKEMSEGDPYYNPNLTLDKSDFSLRARYDLF